MRKFYITTTLPYVNAAPHLGHALEFVQADVIARYHRSIGEDVFFNIGTDEHGLKIYKKSLEEGIDVKSYVDKYAAKFKNFADMLNVSYTNFIRTTDAHHLEAAQSFWKKCYESGDIELRNYRAKYCVGCELEKTDSELVNGRCPLHPNLELEVIEEKNYFFKFSKYQKNLIDLYRENRSFVVPESRFNEIIRFVERGLKDFSVSRLKEKMPWGIPVPGDDEHVMYVWFDALINYISALGWPDNKDKFSEFWGTRESPNAIQIAGKDNLRQQSAMWQAMLMSAGIPNSKQILIHGFITSGGDKMSKSAGNAVDPIEIMDKYGSDALRYYLIREIPSDGDGDFTYKNFDRRYVSDLSNGLGNFASRVQGIAERAGYVEFKKDINKEIDLKIKETKDEISKNINEFKLHRAISPLWDLISFGDRYINKNKPWETNDRDSIFNMIVLLDNIAAMLSIFLPETADKITNSISHKGGKIQVKKGRILFPKI